MNQPLAAHQTLLPSNRFAAAGSVLALGQQGAKPSRQTSSSHRQLWLDISRTAAKHSCHFEQSRTKGMGPRRCTEESTASSCRSGEDLLVVGPGVLGGLVGKLWKEAFPEGEVVGQTNTTTNHERLRALGITPRLKQNTSNRSFSSILFSAPPSGSTDYVAEVKSVLKLWDKQGTFIFTSSSSVFNPAEGKPITEASPLHPLGTSERIDRLLESEVAVLEAGGCVVRFVGLYHATRGPHIFFLRQREVPRWGGHLVNLVHYEDAACMCMKILQGEGSGGSPYRKQTFLGTDVTPITFQEMCETTLSTGAYEGSVHFVGAPEEHSAPGSDNAATRKALNWAPKHESFKAFMLSGAQDWYVQSSSLEAA